MSDDLVDRLLDLGVREGTLGPDTIADFSRALRERARQILDARVATAEREWNASTLAHDRLLEHHRQVLARTIAALEEVLGSAGWGFGKKSQEQLQSLVESLRQELR